MISPGRGQYQMQNQNWFKHAPVTKAWICSLLSSSAAYMFASMESRLLLVPTLGGLFSPKGVFKMIASKCFLRNPSLIIAGVTVLYYMRLLERRFGSRKFVNFIFSNALISICIEAAVYYAVATLYSYDPGSMYFATGPLSLITSLYLNFVCEIPMVVYTRVFGIPFSVHTMPLLMYLQLLTGGRPTLIACFAGALSALVYRKNFCYVQQVNIIPNWITDLLSCTTNPLGWLVDAFCRFGESANTGKILPVAATVERQRIEFIDEYERRLMINQMQQLHQEQRRNPNSNQLHFLNQIFGTYAPGGRIPPPTESQIRQLMEMGLGSREVVVEALRQCGNDASAAANTLLQGSR